MSRLIRLLKPSTQQSNCLIVHWLNGPTYRIKYFTQVSDSDSASGFIFSCTPLAHTQCRPKLFICIAQTPISVCIEKSRPCPLPLNHPLPSLTIPTLPLPPIFCLSRHQTKISVMKTSAGQLVRGLEMEIEKLKGSERSVCARITAHFITGRNGQIWHKIKKKRNTICHVFLA